MCTQIRANAKRSVKCALVVGFSPTRFDVYSMFPLLNLAVIEACVRPMVHIAYDKGTTSTDCRISGSGLQGGIRK